MSLIKKVFENEKNSRRKISTSLFMLLGGSLIASLALHVFFFPTQLIMGGISGAASLVIYATNATLPFGLVMILLNAPIFLMGYFQVSRSFFFQCLVGTLVYGVVTDLTEPLFTPLAEVIFSGAQPIDQVILSTILGGTLFGVGLGMIFVAGYTTGGTDILAIAFRRKFKRFSLGQVIWGFDAIIILATAIVYGKDDPSLIPLALYSALAVYLTGRATDLVIEGVHFKKVAFIISDHSEAIADRIMKEMDRGVTGLRSVGMYTASDRIMIFCVLMQQEIPTLRNLVEGIDPNAFLFVLDSREVVGEGFEGEDNLL